MDNQVEAAEGQEALAPYVGAAPAPARRWNATAVVWVVGCMLVLLTSPISIIARQQQVCLKSGASAECAKAIGHALWAETSRAHQLAVR